MKKDKYFYRNATYSKIGKTIYIIDIDSPETKREELDPWFSLVFQLADGQHSIGELYEFLSKGYHGAVPPTLERTIDSVLERLIQMHLIVLSDVKVELPYYLALPIEMMDVELAKELIAKENSMQNQKLE